MPNVNLIAEQRSSFRVAAKKTRIWFFAFTIVCVVSVGGAGSLLLAAESKRAEVRGLEAEFDKQSPIRDEIEANEGALSKLTPRLASLSTARLATEKWTEIFRHVSLTLPQDTFLTNVRSQIPSDPVKPVEFIVTGMSKEQNLIGDFMLRLQDCGELGSVSLKYTEEKRAQQGTGLEFSISALIEGTEEVSKKDAEEKKS